MNPLHINNESTENKIRETIPFITALKIIKYLEVNLNKEAKENYEIK
jgi:hypothetical protein